MYCFEYIQRAKLKWSCNMETFAFIIGFDCASKLTVQRNRMNQIIINVYHFSLRTIDAACNGEGLEGFLQYILWWFKQDVFTGRRIPGGGFFITRWRQSRKKVS